jgi:hypothetical protein
MKYGVKSRVIGYGVLREMEKEEDFPGKLTI